MGHKKPRPHPPPKVECKHTCQGEEHTITFDGKYLHFPNHPDLKNEQLAYALGGQCRCLDVLAAWRRGSAGSIPEELRKERTASSKWWARVGKPLRETVIQHYSIPWAKDPFDDATCHKLRRDTYTGLAMLDPALLARHEIKVFNPRDDARNLFVVDSMGSSDRETFVPSSYRQQFSRSFTKFMPVKTSVTVSLLWAKRVYDRGLTDVVCSETGTRVFVAQVLEQSDIDHYEAKLKASKVPVKIPWWLWYGKAPDLTLPDRYYVLAGRPDRDSHKSWGGYVWVREGHQKTIFWASNPPAS